MLQPGTRLGGLVIGPLLGRGGMGEVYRAEQIALGRAVAVKRINDNLVQSPDVIARFRREARLAAGISHPNVLTVHDFGEFCDFDGHTHWLLVMELVEGARSLRVMLGGLRWRGATGIIAQACQGLAAAHDKSVIHRDIKPDNLLVAPDGTVKLADFGLATAADVSALTAPGAHVGTPRYMAPEVLRGMASDERSDLYSLGVTWYQAVCGRSPFDGSTGAIMLAHIEAPPPPVRKFNPEVPGEIEVLIHACLAKRPEDRPVSARDLANRLDGFLPKPDRTHTTAAMRALGLESPLAGSPPSVDPQSVTATSLHVPAHPGDRRWFFAIGAAALVLVAGALAAAIAWWGGGRTWDMPARPSWAADYGRDQQGWWADLTIDTQLVRMRYCPPGTYRRGDPPDLRSEDTAYEQQHDVTLTRGYWLAESETTQEVWRALMAVNPAANQQPLHPVEQLTWNDAIQFCRALRQRIPEFEARLPTEAEWERACRAGAELPKEALLDARHDLQRLAVEAAALVDGDRHAQLAAGGSTIAYDAVIAPLAAFKTAHPEIKFLYTVSRHDEDIRFALDTTPPGDVDKDGIEDHSDPGDPFLKPSPQLLSSFTSGEPAIEDFAEDRWGLVMTAYAPIHGSDGRVVAVLGCDITTLTFRQFLARTLRRSAEEVGWFQENSGGHTHPVKEKPANAWGFHDLQGNVSEWCQDTWQPYPAGAVRDPLASEGKQRVFRGGNFKFSSETGRIGMRFRDEPEYKTADRGLRIACDAEAGRR